MQVFPVLSQLFSVTTTFKLKQKFWTSRLNFLNLEIYHHLKNLQQRKLVKMKWTETAYLASRVSRQF